MTMGSDIARALDPVLLAADVGITCDPWQAEVLRLQPRRTLLLCSRQSGKSTVSSLLALHTALYCSGALVLLVSPSLRQSGELFRTTMGFFAKLEGVPELTMESKLRAQLANGSRIISLPGSEKTTRGFSKATLIVVDEAARDLTVGVERLGPEPMHRRAVAAAVAEGHGQRPRGLPSGSETGRGSSPARITSP